MRRIILMALVLAATVAGCNRFPDLSVQITGNLAPDNTCSISPEQEAEVGFGRLDLGFQPLSMRYADYFFTPRIESYLIDNSLDIQAVSQNYQVTSFDVTIKLPDNTVPPLSGGLPNPYNVRATSSFIPPNDSPGDASRGTAAGVVIPDSYRDAIIAIRDQSGFNSIVLDIRANGETSGGFSQSSPVFSWPIELCEGCLGRLCTEDELPLESCFPGQDGWEYCTGIVPTAP